MTYRDLFTPVSASAVPILVVASLLCCTPDTNVGSDALWTEAGPDGPVKTEDSPSLCSDGKDNDGDGFVDCLDQDCVAFAFCRDLGSADRPLPDALAPDAAASDLPLPDHPDLPPPPDLFPMLDFPLAPDAPASDIPSQDLPVPDLPPRTPSPATQAFHARATMIVPRSGSVT